jgi:hypothetical protein
MYKIVVVFFTFCCIAEPFSWRSEDEFEVEKKSEENQEKPKRWRERFNKICSEALHWYSNTFFDEDGSVNRRNVGIAIVCVGIAVAVGYGVFSRKPKQALPLSSSSSVSVSPESPPLTPISAPESLQSPPLTRDAVAALLQYGRCYFETNLKERKQVLDCLAKYDNSEIREEAEKIGFVCYVENGAQRWRYQEKRSVFPGH